MLDLTCVYVFIGKGGRDSRDGPAGDGDVGGGGALLGLRVDEVGEVLAQPLEVLNPERLQGPRHRRPRPALKLRPRVESQAVVEALAQVGTEPRQEALRKHRRRRAHARTDAQKGGQVSGLGLVEEEKKKRLGGLRGQGCASGHTQALVATRKARPQRIEAERGKIGALEG